MIDYLTCDGYHIIYQSATEDPVTVCARLELDRNDGHAVVAMRNGTIIADSSGLREQLDSSWLRANHLLKYF